MSEQAEAAVNIDELVAALFERMPEVDTDEAMQAALIAESEQIHVISEACRKTRAFARSVATFESFAIELESTTPADDRLLLAWGWLLNRVNEAPTRWHMLGAVRLCMPLVSRYLPDQASR